MSYLSWISTEINICISKPWKLFSIQLTKNIYLLNWVALVRQISMRLTIFSCLRSCRIRISLKAVMGNPSFSFSIRTFIHSEPKIKKHLKIVRETANNPYFVVYWLVKNNFGPNNVFWTEKKLLPSDGSKMFWQCSKFFDCLQFFFTSNILSHKFAYLSIFKNIWPH